MSLADAFVEVRPDTRNFGRELDRDLARVDGKKAGAKVGTSFSSGFGGGIKGMATTAAGALGLVGLAQGISSTISGSIDEAREAQKVGRLTEQVIKTTGGAAKVTAADVAALAEALSVKVGVDDEAIQAGSNLLLTFKNVRNEVGKGNDIFNRTTTLSLDMAQAMGTSIPGATKVLGKALNDPVKGMAALSRVGITFTDEQKKMVKGMVDAGDTMGAQKYLLEQLEGRYKGAAAAAADPADKAKVAWDNLKEDMGQKILPILNKVSDWFIKDGIDMLKDFGVQMVAVGTFVSDNREAFLTLLGALVLYKTTMLGIAAVQKAQAIVTALQTANTWLHTTATAANQSMVMTWLGVKGLELAGWVRSAAATAASTVASGAHAVVTGVTLVGAYIKSIAVLAAHTAATLAANVASKAVRVATLAWVGVQWLLNAALTANPVGLIIAAIAALIAIVVVAYKKNETFRNIVNLAWKGIKIAIKVVVEWFKETAWPIMKRVFENIGEKGKWLWDKVLKPTFDAIKGGVKKVADGFTLAKDAIGKAWGKLEGLAKTPIKFVIQKVINGGIIAGFNWLSSRIGGPHVNPFPLPKGFAAGGVIPGWSPGRDNHRYVSATGGVLDLAGGEAVMVPQFTRAMGGLPGIARLNQKFRGMAGGGVIDWLKGAGSGAVNWVQEKAGAIWDAVSDPLGYIKKKIPKIPGAATMTDFAVGVKDKLLGIAVAKIRALWKALQSAVGSMAASSSSGVGGFTGGNALKRVMGVLLGGLSITSTYRSPSHNAAVGGSPYSLHMDRNNPAVDIGGSTRLLDQMYRILRDMGGWRQLLWRVAGHYDHIHVADQGGMIDPGSMGLNMSGRAERMLSPQQTEAFERLVAILESGRGGGLANNPHISVVNHYPQAEPTSVTINRALRLVAALGL